MSVTDVCQARKEQKRQSSLFQHWNKDVRHVRTVTSVITDRVDTDPNLNIMFHAK